MKNFLVLLSLLAVACSCFGQTNTARISGIVTDPEGAVIPGAAVVAVNEATGARNNTLTDQSGLYSIPNLPISQYTLRLEHPGFKAYVRTGINLHSSQVLELNATMILGSVQETITVHADVPLLETRSSDFSQNLEIRSIQDLPLGNRRMMNIVKLMPAAIFMTDNPGGQPVYFLAGGRDQTQMVWIDGGNGQNMRMGAGQQNVVPPVETVQDIQILSTNYAAEYGSSEGGVVVETTKSGTNRFHGSAYEFLRNDKLNAPGLFAPVQNDQKMRPDLRYNVFGGTLGGPIRRSKIFFFVAYEGNRTRTGIATTLTVPTLLQRTGDFSQTFNAKGTLIPIYDPATSPRTQFTGNIIPSTELDPVAVKLMSYYPLPNRVPSNIAGANNFRGIEKLTNSLSFYMIKIDYNLSDRHKFTGRWIYSPSTYDVVRSVYPDRGADTQRRDHIGHSTLGYASWTYVISPTKVNDLRLTRTYRVADGESLSVGGGYPQKIGLTGVPGDAFPYIAPAGFSPLGITNQLRLQVPVAQNQAVENFSWILGRHALKFGAEVRESLDNDLNAFLMAGSFTFGTQATGLPGNSATGNGLASLLVGFPTAFRDAMTDKIYRRSWYYGAFVQDNWIVSPNLTINLGLRWEVDSPMIDLNNKLNSFDATRINPVSGTPGVVRFAGIDGYPRNPYNWDLNNFGPRFGFAWKPFNSTKTVVRGGYGIFFGLPFAAGLPVVALGHETSAELNSPDNGITAPFYLRDGVPVEPRPPVLSDSYGAVPAGQNPKTAVTYFNRNRSTGYMQQFNLDFQRELSSVSRVTFSFIGNLGRRLQSTDLSINQIPPNRLGPGASLADRPFPQFSDVRMVLPTIGNSNYYAGIARYEKRYGNGLSAVASYTWSKWLANTYDDWVGTPAGYSNYYNQRADYGPTQHDVEHHVSFGPLYELPFGPGKRWLSSGVLGQVIGGWVVGNVSTIYSGFPVTVTCNTNSTNAYSSGPLRPNISGNPNLPGDSRTLNRAFDTSVFSQPAAYQFGNAGVGIVRAPGFFEMDFSVIRQFRFREGVLMQFRLEAFNALNHPNLNAPNTVYGSAAFGTITSERQARQVQVGVRISF